MYIASAGKGKPVILVHGFASSVWTSWKFNFNDLAKNFHVYGVDLLGFGKSDRPDASYSLDFFAENVKAVVDHYDLGRPSLIGWSMGGGTILQYAMKYPRNLDKLVLVDASRLRKTPPSASPSPPQPPHGEPLTRERVLKDWEKYFYDKAKVPKEIVAEAFELNSLPGSRKVRDTFRSNRWESFYDQLKQIKAPTLILVGSHSSLPLEEARTAEKMMNAEVYVFDKARHALHIEKADEFNKVVNQFLLR